MIKEGAIKTAHPNEPLPIGLPKDYKEALRTTPCLQSAKKAIMSIAILL
jgi:hypothetical protein